MYAFTYQTAHKLSDFQIKMVNIADPILTDHDVMVNVQAASFNPVDTKVRQSRSASTDRGGILGWDAAGIIEKLGKNVRGFKVGDEVYYAGDVQRDGSYAKLQAVDYRLIARKPRAFDFAQAAALPLTALTAHEALFERGFNYTKDTKVLIIGGAGGVGSIAIQLLKVHTQAKVIATASRSKTIEWVQHMGADHVIGRNLQGELAQFGPMDIVFCTTHAHEYLPIIPSILKPFGSLILIEMNDPKSFDITSFKSKSLSIHWEFMFTKSMHGHHPEQQGIFLSNLAKLVECGKIKATLGQTMQASVENIRQAHEFLESGATIGKMAIMYT